MNNSTPELVVMLTHHDLTVDNAEEIFEICRESPARFWGFKEKPLPIDRMKALFKRMKECGKTTFLEVVAYDEAAGLEGARMAVECACDILMGTTYHPSIARFCKEHGLRYMPFVGRIEGRPSVLRGSLEEMVAEAERALAGGAWGIDLLGYRYEGDAEKLIRGFVEQIDAPVCIAGSIDSCARLDFIRNVSPWSFTIGSAFFDHRFGPDFPDQIATVTDRIKS